MEHESLETADMQSFSALVALQKLDEEYQNFLITLSKTYEEAKSEEEKQQILQEHLSGEYKTLLARYELLENQCEGSTRLQVRLSIWELTLWASRMGLLGAEDAVLARMLQEDLDLPEAVKLARELFFAAYGGADREKKSLSSLRTLENSIVPEVRAAALFYRAEIERRNSPEDAVFLLRQIIADYPQTEIASRAKSTIFDIQNLEIGMIAPEITGIDHLGKAFSLSEYRGKVVVLNFWAFW
jgi:AhpC/TSA family